MFNRIPVENTEAAKQRAALKRHTSLKDVADQVLTFCRAETVTGQVLVIDGGIVFH
jgi:3-oxoacyl-[acyl-carrier protein] reductase